MAAAFGDLVSEVDKAAMTGPILDWLAASARRSVAESIAGWRDDDLAFVKDWGFRLDRITTPVAIWQGDQDRMVPRPTATGWPPTSPAPPSTSKRTRATSPC